MVHKLKHIHHNDPKIHHNKTLSPVGFVGVVVVPAHGKVLKIIIFFLNLKSTESTIEKYYIREWEQKITFHIHFVNHLQAKMIISYVMLQQALHWNEQSYSNTFRIGALKMQLLKVCTILTSSNFIISKQSSVFSSFLSPFYQTLASSPVLVSLLFFLHHWVSGLSFVVLPSLSIKTEFLT